MSPLAKGLGMHLRRMRVAGRSMKHAARATTTNLMASASMGAQFGLLGGATYGTLKEPEMTSTAQGAATGLALGVVAAPAISASRYGYRRFGAKGAALGLIPVAAAYGIKRALTQEQLEQRREAGRASARKRRHGAD